MESWGPSKTVDTHISDPNKYTLNFCLDMASSGHIQDSMGLVGNFSLGIFFALLAMLYAIFFLKVEKFD